MDAETSHTELRTLIFTARKQGYVTYREIEDCLTDGLHDASKLETVVCLLNEMGMEVLDRPPDPDSLVLRAEPIYEDVVEETEEDLSTVFESDASPPVGYLSAIRSRVARSPPPTNPTASTWTDGLWPIRSTDVTRSGTSRSRSRSWAGPAS